MTSSIFGWIFISINKSLDTRFGLWLMVDVRGNNCFPFFIVFIFGWYLHVLFRSWQLVQLKSRRSSHILILFCFIIPEQCSIILILFKISTFNFYCCYYYCWRDLFKLRERNTLPICLISLELWNKITNINPVRARENRYEEWIGLDK